jgi:hypothetical protein
MAPRTIARIATYFDGLQRTADRGCRLLVVAIAICAPGAAIADLPAASRSVQANNALSDAAIRATLKTIDQESAALSTRTLEQVLAQDAKITAVMDLGTGSKTLHFTPSEYLAMAAPIFEKIRAEKIAYSYSATEPVIRFENKGKEAHSTSIVTETYRYADGREVKTINLSTAQFELREGRAVIVAIKMVAQSPSM